MLGAQLVGHLDDRLDVGPFFVVDGTVGVQDVAGPAADRFDRDAVFLGSGLEGGEVRFGLADRLAKKVDRVEVQLGEIEAEGF